LRETLHVTRPWQTLIVIAVTTCGLSHNEAANADSVQEITGSLGGTSDFVFRGLSLSRGKPAAQASFDVEFAHEYYAGAFVATCDPNAGPSPNVEMDFWAGRYWRMSDNFSGDLRLSEYYYPDDPRHVGYDRTELTATLGFRNRVYLAAIYSPNMSGLGSSRTYHEGMVWAAELSARQPLTERLSLSAGVGHYGLDEVYDDNYNYWNVTFIATLAQFELQLAYLGVDGEAAQHFDPESVEDRVALTALWRFSSSH